jgi:hypothetical protein
MAIQHARRLYAGADLPALLQLSAEQIDRLVKTGQLRQIRICGEVRFDSRDLDALIQAYKSIAQRKEEGHLYA